ncbi:glycosyltransferase [Patescibacteria group bacterium]|nr:glycosyltransferase [Patescibacteria group bacterium]
MTQFFTFQMLTYLFKQIYKHRQIIRYIISGGTAATVNLVLLFVLTDIFGIWYLLSSTLAFSTAFFVSFYLQKFWTFRSKNQEKIYQQMALYFSVAVINLGLNAALMYFSVDILRIWYLFAQILVSGIIAVESFLVYKFLIFNRQGNSVLSVVVPKENLKVLITTGIFPPDIGGPATQIERLAGDLAGAGFVVSVLTYGAPEKKAWNFRVFAVSKSWPAGWRQFLYALKTFWLARQADFIYTTDLYAPGYSSMLATQFWRKKLAVRFAGDSAWETAQNMGLCKDDVVAFQSKKYGKFIEKRKAQRAKILKSADAVVAVSNFMKELAVKIGAAPQKVRVIYNAVDFMSVPPQWQNTTKPVLVFAGRLTPWKGVEMLILVVAKLKEKYPDIIFEILGDGPELNSLKFLVKSLSRAGSRDLKLEENVNFHGRVSEEESRQIFARSTIFVLNSNYEGLPHAILNALSVGLPVITTPVGGNPEVIIDNENGLLAPHNNETAWQTAIDKLLQDKSLREKFSANGKKTLEKFKWEELIKKTIEVFKNPDFISKK